MSNITPESIAVLRGMRDEFQRNVETLDANGRLSVPMMGVRNMYEQQAEAIQAALSAFDKLGRFEKMLAAAVEIATGAGTIALFSNQKWNVDWAEDGVYDTPLEAFEALNDEEGDRPKTGCPHEDTKEIDGKVFCEDCTTEWGI